MLEVLGQRILIKINEKDETTKNGIYIPDTMAAPVGAVETGEIVSIGVDVNLVKPKQNVIYNKLASTEVVDGDVKYVIVNEIEVLAIIK